MKRIVLAIAVLTVVIAGAESFWTPRKLVGTYPTWNYWWLNVRIGIDQFDTVYCAVTRYNYSQSDPDFDLYVLNSDGDSMRATGPWNGFEHQPIVQDAAGANVYIDQPLLGFAISGDYHMDAGAVDDSNTVSSTNSYNDDIYFTRLGADGGRITWRQVIYSGDPWAGRTDLAIDARGWLHCAFADSLEYLIHGVSSDKGVTWKWDTLDNIRVMSHARVVTTPDTCTHIVYRTWTSGVQLRYLRLRPDGSLGVGSTVFSTGTERWEPNLAVDTAGDLRVVFIDGSQNAPNLYYTVLRGDLDTGGEPSHDTLLTLLPDTIIETDPVRIAGPKIAVDSRNRAQILFEQGVYGNNTTKYVYHLREGAAQSVEELPVRPVTRSMRVVPSPIRTTGKLSFSLPVAGDASLTVFDATGRRVLTRDLGALAVGTHSVELSRTRLASGAYFLTLEAGRCRYRSKMLVAD